MCVSTHPQFSGIAITFGQRKNKAALTPPKEYEMNTIINVGEKDLEKFVLEQLTSALPKLIHSAIHRGINFSTVRRTCNGVTEPSRNSKCGQIWQELDLLSMAGIAPTLNQIQRVATMQGWNLNNAKTEYYAWRRFHSS